MIFDTGELPTSALYHRLKGGSGVVLTACNRCHEGLRLIRVLGDRLTLFKLHLCSNKVSISFRLLIYHYQCNVVNTFSISCKVVLLFLYERNRKKCYKFNGNLNL